MSAETAFKEHCGEGIEFVSTELFDQDRRREFCFKALGQCRAFGYVCLGISEEEIAIRAARDARFWVICVQDRYK